MSAPEPAATLVSKGPDGVELRVEFLNLADRFAHRFLALDESGASILLFETIEDYQAEWPCSPVLQELHIEEIGEGSEQAAMLVGKASDTHWSVVVRPYESEGMAGFVVESACRVKSLPSWLGSSYRLGKEVKSLATHASAELDSDLGSFRILAIPVEKPKPQMGELSIQHGRLVFSVDSLTELSPPETIQWRYGVWVV